MSDDEPPSVPDPQVHAGPTRGSIFEPPDWPAEVAAWKQQERELEAERHRKRAKLEQE